MFHQEQPPGRCTDTCPFQHGAGALKGVQPSAVPSSSQVQNVLLERLIVVGLRKDNLKEVIIGANSLCYGQLQALHGEPAVQGEPQVSRAQRTAWVGTGPS